MLMKWEGGDRAGVCAGTRRTMRACLFKEGQGLVDVGGLTKDLAGATSFRHPLTPRQVHKVQL